MNEFKIDVVIVTNERYPQLLKCVKYLCANSLKPKNIVIIDSSNNFNKVVKKIFLLIENNAIQLKYLKVPHKGVGYSRNVGLLNVKSPYFAFIDDDEYAPEFWLQRIRGIFNSHKEVHVLAGPKIPNDKNNYWHKVWEALLKKEFSYKGRVDVIPSGNSVYLTSFIKKNKIKFDERFKQCSEDQAFSYDLRKRKANIYFHKDLWVEHDVRKSLIPFIRQWFFYGVNKHLFHKLYFGSGTISEFIKIPITIRNLGKTFPYRVDNMEFNIIPGIILLNLTFLVGFMYSFLGLK